MAFVNFRRRVAKEQLNTDRALSKDSTSSNGLAEGSAKALALDADPWARAQQQLASFDTHRCVMLKHEDWRELSSVMSSVNSLYSSSSGCGPPAFMFTLELLLQLGQVTSCLLSLNGDDPAFSVARVAQAIKTTTTVVESCHNVSQRPGLPPDLADSLARQRCEQTSLLQAMAWALRQEARALFFNPRPTALSLATALLDLFRSLERIWPDDIFAPPADEAAITAAGMTVAPAAGQTTSQTAAAGLPASDGDPAAARLADPAAQLAMAMLRCAGRAMGEVGASSSKQIMLSGLRVADDLMHQISSLIARVEGAGGGAEQHQPQIRELLQSPSILQLMLAMLAVQTQRLQQQLGMHDADSFAVQHPVVHDAAALQDRLSGAAGSCSSLSSSSEDGSSCSCSCGTCRSSGAAPSSKQQACTCRHHHQQQQLQGLQHSTKQQEKQLQQHTVCAGESTDEEDDGHAGPGNLHQLWNQVLGMTGKPAAADQPQQQEQGPATPLLQFWAGLGLPGPLLELASSSDVFTRAADVEYVQACRVARFLLQGASHLQPNSSRELAGSSSRAHALLRRRSSTAGDDRTDRAALDLAGELSTAAAGAARGVLGVSSSRDLSPGSPSSPMSPRTPSSPREEEDIGRPGAVSPSAATAAHLVDDCRDYGFRGQEELEVLGLQQQLPLMLLDTAVALSSGRFDGPLAAQQCAALQHVQHRRRGSLGSSSSLARLSSSSCALPPSPLEMVSAACAAAAYSARCWPVLQKVGAVQKDGSSNLAGGAPPGLFKLSSVTWQEYELQPDSHLPVQELLQLVVEVVQQLLGHQDPQQQQQHQEHLLDALLGNSRDKQQPNIAVAAAAGSNGAAGDTGAASAAQADQQHQAVLASADESRAEALGSLAPADALDASTATKAKQSAAPVPPDVQADAAAAAGVATSCLLGTAVAAPSRAPLSPRTREALWGLLEVLTAVSKLPWEVDDAAADTQLDQEHHHHHHHHSSHAHDDAAAHYDVHAAAGARRPQRTLASRQQQLDALYTADAWRAMCQPVAAAVEAVLRGCSGTSAVVPRGAARGGGVFLQAAVSQWLGRERQSMLHPATVALGSCLASMCAPIGRPGPLVAAVGACEAGSHAQLQLFALLTSKIKLMMTDTSGRKELIAMHPIEQTPVYILDGLARQLQQHSDCSAEGSADSAALGACAEQERIRVAAAAVLWLLVLGRLIKLRGRLLSEVLQRNREAAGVGRGGDSSGSVTSTLHNAFWHVQMAMASALSVEKHIALLAGMHSGTVGSILAAQAQQLPHSEQQQPQQLAGQQVVLQNSLQDSQQGTAAAGTPPVGGFDLQLVLQQLQQEVLPSLKHAVQLLKAAMKLARHHHETGFASGFAAGFTAGYAAAVAAATAVGGASGHGLHSMNFASPAGVLQQGCLRELPAQLKAFGGVLSGHLLVPFCCTNPLCLNTANVSELGLLGDGSCGSVRPVLCAKCGVARYCSVGCRAQHKSRHKPLCKQLCARMEWSRAHG